MAFLSQLYRYRQREQRSPLEDFLTEALAEWLRQATLAGELKPTLLSLFKFHALQDLPESALREIHWQTQYVIGPGNGPATNKRPDLIGRGPDIFLIIENKTWAPFTTHVGEDGVDVQDQLSIYERYLNTRQERYKAIALLTHATVPPKRWQGAVCYWREVDGYLARSLKGSSNTALQFVAGNLLAFIKEQNMGGTRIDLGDIVAIPAYNRLWEGMAKLGDIAAKQLNHSVQSLSGSSLAVLKTRKPDGDFVPWRFFGGLMTSQGHKSNDSPLALWCGVVADEAYQLAPQVKNLPELNVGLGIWRYKDPLEADDISLIDTLVATLNGADAGSGWQLTIIDRDKHGPCVLISRRMNLIEVHRLANGEDWDDVAADFFGQGSKALLEALQHTTNDGKSNFERALYEMTQEAEPV